MVRLLSHFTTLMALRLVRVLLIMHLRPPRRASIATNSRDCHERTTLSGRVRFGTHDASVAVTSTRI